MLKIRLIFTLLLFALVMLLWSCSGTKVLSFLFDGYKAPEPKQETALADTVPVADSLNLSQLASLPGQKQYSYHPPYQNKKCSICHDKSTMGKLTMPVPELCYECHDNFADTYKVLHGPVANGACTTCHSPHMAEGEKLTLMQGQKLCLFCHDSQEIFAGKAHLEIGETKCTTCHNPHGGDERPFLLTAQTK
jgi:predicted CXXCH cytochrome family protein